MKRVRFLMVGGFLGAGKTTAIARLARHYLGQGRNVALVTNDQAYDLVDTQSLRAQGFRVGEVPGACFCCKFEDLVQTAEQLHQADAPDIIIAEPVGSCTDLAATVIEPLRRLYGERFEVGRLAVLLKPEHGRKILRQQGSGFSPQAAYIFLKQIEEADIVVINKIDKLSGAERDELAELVRDRFPDKEILAASAQRGDGFDALIDALDRSAGPSAEEFMDLDYDVYAQGEAELGWLNCRVRVESAAGKPFSLDELLSQLVAHLHEAFLEHGAEPAHLKVLGQAEQQAAVANLVGSGIEIELSLASAVVTNAADLIVNARVAADPESLERMTRQSIASLADHHRLSHTVVGLQCFRPGRPTPTHRVTAN